MPAIDKQKNLVNTYEMPSDHLEAIIPDDNNDLAYVTRGIYIGSIGNIRIQPENGSPVTFVGLVPGIILPVRATRVLATGTTASNLIAMY